MPAVPSTESEEFAGESSAGGSGRRAREAPAMWNPNAAASWSLLLTPVFGAFIQMKNWRAMGNEYNARISGMWAAWSLAILIGTAFAGVLLPESKAFDMGTRLLGFALLIAWYYSSGKKQMTHVAARYGKNYQRKGWGKPLLLGVLGILGYFALIMAFWFVLGFFDGSADQVEPTSQTHLQTIAPVS